MDALDTLIHGGNNMKRIIAIIISVIMVCFIFVGCSETNHKASSENHRFIEIESDLEMDSSGITVRGNTIYADKETGVMYLVFYGANRAGITVLLDADGKPLLYDFDKKR